MRSQKGKKIKNSRCDREEDKVVILIVDISIPVYRDRRNDNLIIEKSRF